MRFSLNSICGDRNDFLSLASSVWILGTLHHHPTPHIHAFICLWMSPFCLGLQRTGSGFVSGACWQSGSHRHVRNSLILSDGFRPLHTDIMSSNGPSMTLTHCGIVALLRATEWDGSSLGNMTRHLSNAILLFCQWKQPHIGRTVL